MAEIPDYVEVDPDIPWAPGSELRLTFSTVGITYMTATQIAVAERNLEKKKSFEVLRHSLPQGDGFVQEFYFDVRVKEPVKSDDPRIQEAGITGGLIAKIIITAFVLGVFMLSLKSVQIKVEKAAGEAAEKIGQAAERSEGFIKELGVTITKAAVAAAILLVLWRHA